MYKLINLNDLSREEQISKLNEFYDKKTYTYIGMELSNSNLSTIKDMLRLEEPTYYTISGKNINEIYNLEGDLQYSPDLNFLFIEDYYNDLMRERSWAYWFNDIVDSNKENKYEQS